MWSDDEKCDQENEWLRAEIERLKHECEVWYKHNQTASAMYRGELEENERSRAEIARLRVALESYVPTRYHDEIVEQAVKQRVEETQELRAEIARLKADNLAAFERGMIANKAFHDVAVRQRDEAQNERRLLSEECRRLRDENEKLRGD